MNQKHDRQKLVEIARNTLIATDERCASVFSFAWLFLFIVLISLSSSPALGDGICIWNDPDEPPPTSEENCKKCKELDIGPSSPCWEWCEQHYPYNNCSQNICSLPQVCPWNISISPPFLETYQIGQNIEFSIAAGVDAWIASHSECSTGEQNTYWNFGDGKTSAGLDNKTVNHAYEYEDEFPVRAVFQFSSLNFPTAECYVDTGVNVKGGGPDLILTSVVSPTSGTAGDMINVQAFVKNQGTVETDSFRLQFLLSPDNTISLGDINTGYGCTVAALAPGASFKCSGSIKIPANTPNGTYFLGAYADYFEKIPETIEHNNSLATNHTITIDGGGGGPLADLIPLSVTSPTIGVAGGMIDAKALVKNQGSNHAGVFRLSFYLSTDNTITLTDIDTGYGCNFPYLAKGASTTCTGKIKIPANTPEGMHYLGAFADITQIIPEGSEINNGLAASNTINIYHSIFADVLPAGWAYNYIKAIRDAGITGGCGNGNYCPTSFVTREQMAAFLVRAVEGEPPKDYCGYFPPFSDVSWSQWSCPYIKRLAEKNITGGCGNGNYCPLQLVTREQMAVFIVRSLEGDPWSNYCQGLRPFNDVQANAWSCGHIKRLEELGITQGCGNGNYCPSKFVTREEMAAFLARAFLGMD